MSAPGASLSRDNLRRLRGRTSVGLVQLVAATGRVDLVTATGLRRVAQYADAVGADGGTNGIESLDGGVDSSTGAMASSSSGAESTGEPLPCDNGIQDAIARRRDEQQNPNDDVDGKIAALLYAYMNRGAAARGEDGAGAGTEGSEDLWTRFGRYRQLRALT